MQYTKQNIERICCLCCLCLHTHYIYIHKYSYIYTNAYIYNSYRRTGRHTHTHISIHIRVNTHVWVQCKWTHHRTLTVRFFVFLRFSDRSSSAIIVVYVAGRRRCRRICMYCIYIPKQFRAHMLALMPNTRHVQSHSHCIQQPFVYVHVRVSHSQFVILYICLYLSINLYCCCCYIVFYCVV